MLTLLACALGGFSGMAENAYFTAEINADMMTVNATVTPVQNTPYVNVQEIMRQLGGTTIVMADQIEATLSSKTATLMDNQVSVTLPDKSFALSMPCRIIDNAICVPLADAGVFFNNAFGVSLEKIVEAPETPVTSAPEVFEESPLDKEDASLLEAIADTPAAASESAQGEEGNQKEGEISEGESGEKTPAEEDAAAPSDTVQALDGPIDFALVKNVGGSIVIDPGHGGNDKGAGSQDGLQEKDVLLQIAIRMRRILKETTAAKVYLTREEDVDMSAGQRKAVAETTGCDIFISLQSGYSVNPHRRGGTVWHDAPPVVPENQELSDTAREQYEKRKRCAEKASRVAAKIQGALGSKSAIGPVDAHAAPLIMQRELGVPVVVIEAGYLSNQETCSLLKDEGRQEQLASELAWAAAQALR